MLLMFHSSGGEFFPYIQPEPPMAQVGTIPSSLTFLQNQIHINCEGKKKINPMHVIHYFLSLWNAKMWE